MTGLTYRQQLVLDFIRASIAKRGYPPTLREIGRHLGIRSTNGVNDHLRALERKGHLKRDLMQARALRPTEIEEPPSPEAFAVPLDPVAGLHREIADYRELLRRVLIVTHCIDRLSPQGAVLLDDIRRVLGPRLKRVS